MLVVLLPMMKPFPEQQELRPTKSRQVLALYPGLRQETVLLTNHLTWLVKELGQVVPWVVRPMSHRLSIQDRAWDSIRYL